MYKRYDKISFLYCFALQFFFGERILFYYRCCNTLDIFILVWYYISHYTDNWKHNTRIFHNNKRHSVVSKEKKKINSVFDIRNKYLLHRIKNNFSPMANWRIIGLITVLRAPRGRRQLIPTMKLIREKITKPIRVFQLSLGGNTS